MNILISKDLMVNLKRLEIFSIDLGINLTGPERQTGEDIQIVIRDYFVKTYYDLTGTFAKKFGNIGVLNFYVDDRLPYNIMLIFKGKDIYEFNYINKEIPISIFLANSLKKIDDGSLSPIDSKKEVETVNDKNKLKYLSREQLMDELVKRNNIE